MRSKKVELDKVDEFKTHPILEGMAIGLLILVSIATSASFLYFQAVDAVKAEIREGVLRSVTSIAAMVEGDKHQQFNSKEQKYDPNYLEFVAPLERARQAAKYVPYIYTNILKDDKVYFVANPSPQLDLDNDGFPDDAPDLMDPYDAPSESLLTALHEQKETVDKEPYSDQWGTFISAYAPIYTTRGDFVGTLGMDLDFSGFEKRLLPTKNAFKTAAITGVVMAVLVGITVWYNRRIVRQLNASRMEVAIKYAEANEYIHQTNQYRSDLIRYLSNSLDKLEPDKCKDIYSSLNLIAELEKDDYSLEKQNFSLKKMMDDTLLQQGMTGRITYKIAANIPEHLHGESDQLHKIFNYIFSAGINCPVAEVNFKLQKETLHDIIFSVEFLADKSKEQNQLTTQFRNKFTLLEHTNDNALLASANDLHPAIAYKMLTQIGAEMDMAGDYPKLIAFSLRMDKYVESQAA